MKFFLPTIALLVLLLCVYAFIEGVEVVTVKNEVGTQTDGPLKQAIDKRTTLFCKIESFWAKYDVWGDTDTVYRPAAEAKADVLPTSEQQAGCDPKGG
ncbi:hypothetical protein imdm_12 [gamma proteobacterium IMCC2047]|nr:hypothetical protein imdm_12 [gamma proteobacterium IMCC2047]